MYQFNSNAELNEHNTNLKNVLDFELKEYQKALTILENKYNDYRGVYLISNFKEKYRAIVSLCEDVDKAWEMDSADEIFQVDSQEKVVFDGLSRCVKDIFSLREDTVGLFPEYLLHY
jgi:hypothetical protein